MRIIAIEFQTKFSTVLFSNSSPILWSLFCRTNNFDFIKKENSLLLLFENSCEWNTERERESEKKRGSKVKERERVEKNWWEWKREKERRRRILERKERERLEREQECAYTSGLARKWEKEGGRASEREKKRVREREREEEKWNKGSKNLW